MDNYLKENRNGICIRKYPSTFLLVDSAVADMKTGAFRKDGMARFPEECRPAIQVAPRFAERLEKRALCGTLNAISNRPREQKKVLLANPIYYKKR